LTKEQIDIYYNNARNKAELTNSNRHPESVVNELKSWLNEHLAYPYPSKPEKKI